LFIEELKLCKKLKEFYLYGFCVVYDHIHLMIHPGEKYNISQIIKSLKENISRDINYIIFNYVYEGDTSTCRLHIRELIKQYQKTFIQKYQQNINLFPKFQWQKSFHDHIIRNGVDFYNHFNYTVYNHLKHQLLENWQYTSLNYLNIIDESL